MTASLRIVLAVIGPLVAAIATGGQALAHAALTVASPADGAVVASPPAQLTLSFSEPVSPLMMTLIGPDGTSRLLPHHVLRGSTLTIEPPPGLLHGTHVLSWRVVSQDGHPVGGAIVFSIGAPSLNPPVAAPFVDPVVSAALWLGKLGLYLGLFFGVGGAAFAAWVAPLGPDARRTCAALIGLGLASVPLLLAAQGLDALGLSPASLAESRIWRAAAGSSLGGTAIIAMAALLAGLGSLLWRARAGRHLPALALLGVGLALAASGHASAAAPQALMRPAVFLHAIGVALWAGALAPLMFALRRTDGAAALDIFSRRIPVIVAIILASGAVLAVVQVETPGALLTTAYGRVLLSKLGLVAALFGLAGWNRLRLTACASAGEHGACRRLRRVIAAEILLMVLVFGTAALWRFTPPPRALAVAAAQPASLHIHTPEAMADLVVTPGRAGPVAIEISLMDGAFGPLPARDVRIALSNPGAGIAAIDRPAERGVDGVWRGAANLPVPGRWSVELEILVSDFEMLRLSGTIVIGP